MTVLDEISLLRLIEGMHDPSEKQKILDRLHIIVNVMDATHLDIQSAHGRVWLVERKQRTGIVKEIMICRRIPALVKCTCKAAWITSLRLDCPSLGRMRSENGENADRAERRGRLKRTKQGLFKFKTTIINANLEANRILTTRIDKKSWLKKRKWRD